ncbi:MAG: ATP-binding cassette domain-containing protein, partial [Streptococcus parasanguinis]|nr:ATP-binding cassette domain-containing protein [Streptococcus parasanguinis]
MIQIEHLSVAYQQTLALEDLSLTIQGPTILGILGPNGAGKSTLIKAMLGLLPHAGKVLLDQKDLGQALQRVAYVEQKSA